MSGNVTNPFNYNQTATYLGQQVKIVDSTNDNKIVIEFEDGSRKNVSSFELMSTSLFSWQQEIKEYNDKMIENNNKRIKKYRAIAQEADAEKKTLWKQIKDVKVIIRNKCSDWGTRFLHAMNNEQKEEYKALTGETRDLKFAATAAGNKSFSASLSAFMVACDNSNYA